MSKKKILIAPLFWGIGHATKILLKNILNSKEDKILQRNSYRVGTSKKSLENSKNMF